jgi:hypothetical protein
MADYQGAIPASASASSCCTSFLGTRARYACVQPFQTVGTVGFADDFLRFRHQPLCVKLFEAYDVLVTTIAMP